MFGYLESTQFVAVGTVHAFSVIECDIGSAVLEYHRSVEWTGRKDLVPVCLVECPVSEAFPYLPFVARVDIQGVAMPLLGIDWSIRRWLSRNQGQLGRSMLDSCT